MEQKICKWKTNKTPLIHDEEYVHIINKDKFNWNNEREIFDYLNYAGEWDYTYS